MSEVLWTVGLLSFPTFVVALIWWRGIDFKIHDPPEDAE